MKVYVKNNYAKQHAILLMLFIFCSFLFNISHSTAMNAKMYKFSKEISQAAAQNTSPNEILRFTEADKRVESRLKMDIEERDPLKYMALKKEIVELYGGVKNNQNENQSENQRNVRFKQSPPAPALDEIKPYEMGKIGVPTSKTYSNNEVVVPIVDLLSDSTYIKYGLNKEVLMKFDAKNLQQTESFWCSAGNHDVKDEIKFYIEFSKSFSLSAMWIHWAFAPGEFRVKYSNDKKTWEDLLGGYRLSVKGGDVNWWRSILLNPKTRWQYKSFDEKINFDEPFFAKYIELTMRIPVNQYFGIFNIEFYTKAKSLVMLKSKLVGEDICLSVANGKMTNNSPALGVNCLQAISYGDNRDLWVLNSNGYITTHKENKCLQSPNLEQVNIIDCGLSNDFKDDREKWTIDYDGKIRSMKEQFTCLTISDQSFGDTLLPSEMKVSATSKSSSGSNNPENAFERDSPSYWASNPALQNVIFEIYFHKYSLFVKRMEIEWKFPAKAFTVSGMLSDGYWKLFYASKDNRETKIDVNLNNYDLLGIKIVMEESTTKFDMKNIYGISNISIHTGARSVRREPCNNIIGGGNLWEIVYVGEPEDVTAMEYKKAWAGLHVTRNKFDSLKGLYMKIPETLLTMKNNAGNIKKSILKVQSKFDDLEKTLSKYEDFFLKDPLKIIGLATSKYYPAADCAHIIRTYPNKRSGYYWIKNECMNKPLRVYCDFDTYENKAGLDYYIFNDNQSENTRMQIRQQEDVKLACNKIGMEPIEIKNYKMLRLVLKLLKDTKYNLNAESHNFIPIGYDYSCDYASCSKLYRSFNDVQSSEMNDIFSIYKKETSSNLLSDIFANSEMNHEDVKNSAGISSNYKIAYGKLSKQNIIAVVCSTNKDGTKIENSYTDIECDTNIRGDSFRKLEMFSHMTFVCPRDCSKSMSTVYGSSIYTDNSSICKAAVHSGAIEDNEGGIVELSVEPGRSNYKGSSAHNVESVDYADKWDRSFTVSKYKPYCPIDKIKQYAQAMGVSSFMSVQDKAELIEELKSNIQSQLKEFIKNNTNSKDNSSNKVEKLLLASELLKFVQKNEFENTSHVLNTQNPLLANTSPAERSQTTTEESLVSLSAINNKDEKTVSTYKQIADAFKMLIGKSATEISNLTTDKNIGINSLLSKYLTYDNKLETIQKFVYEIDIKSQIKVKKQEHLVNQLKSKINEYQMRENFLEDYNSQSILDNYEIFNSKLGNGEPTKWEYYMYNLNGHFKTIKQTGEFIDNRSGSHLIIKSRDFYDFEMKFSVIIQGSNTFGVCFRYVDSFNYYIFEVSNQSKGFKRIRKFIDGESQTVDIKYDGGYVQNTWYHFKIIGQQNRFEVYMTTDSSENMNEHFDLAFKFADNQLVHGTFAFASYGLTSMMLDNISAVHLSCLEGENKLKDIINIVTPDCPRYTEELKSLFKYTWRGIDPIEYVNGPSIWSILKGVDGRARTLAQTSLIHSTSPNEEGALIVLDQPNKMCSRGKISIKFKALDSGIIGIIFRFDKDTSNHYILEVSDQFVRMRRKVNGKFNLLSINQLIGYNKDTWMKLMISMDQNKFNAYISDKNGLEGNMVKVFSSDIFDNEIKFGLVGLSTYKTKAFFDEITLDTINEGQVDLDSIESMENRLFVEEELLPLPKSRIPKKMFDRLNSSIVNYSWGKCVKYATPDEKNKLCDILFKSPNEIQKCNKNFCRSCCDKNTDPTNPHYKYLCGKQCHMLDSTNENNSSWKNCSEPTHSEKSIYPYCENIFKGDFYQTSRCKVDMCNLCCASFDFTAKSKLSQLNLQSCYKGCVKTFDIMPDKQQ